MKQFPHEFSDLLSERALAVMSGEKSAILADLTDESQHFFIMEDAISEAGAALCEEIFDREFYDGMGDIEAALQPGWITEMTQNYRETLGKTMRVRSKPLVDPREPLYQKAESVGLLRMLRSESLLRLTEAVTGFELESGYGTQISCNGPGDYVGAHNDHHPEFEWARNGYVDVQFMIANAGLEHQWLVHEWQGHLQKIWSLKQRGGISFFRQPFWHYTTPFVPVPGKEATARRWVVGQVFRIRGMLSGRKPKGSPEFMRAWAGTSGQPSVLPVPEIAAPPNEARERLTDGPRPLRDSRLWSWQREFYERQGLDAWSKGFVPSQITNNPVVACNYVDMLEALLLDLEQAGQLEPGQDLTCLELGAGSARLAYLIVKEIQRRKASVTHRVRLRYIVADFAGLTIDHWRTVPELTELEQSGTLIFAKYDAAAPERLRGSLAGEEEDLTPLLVGSAHPVVVIANYWMDSIEHDLYRRTGAGLELGLVEVAAERDRESRAISDVRVNVNYVANLCSYDDEQWDRVLHEYARSLPAGTAFSFPISALRCLEALRRLCDDRLVIFAADKGYPCDAEMVGSEPLHVSTHGSLSLMVNFGALAEYVELSGGLSWLNSQRSGEMVMFASSFVQRPHQLEHLAEAFQRAAASCHPHDVHQVAEALLGHPDLSLRLALALLRSTRFDPWVFGRLAPGLRALGRTALGPVADEMEEVLCQVGERHLSLGADQDIALEIAVLLQLAGKPEQAHAYYTRSLARRPTPGAFHNLGLCCYELERLDEAMAAFQRALELAPEHDAARRWQRECLTLRNARATGPRAHQGGAAPNTPALAISE